jgi:hypothetical protein
MIRAVAADRYDFAQDVVTAWRRKTAVEATRREHYIAYYAHRNPRFTALRRVWKKWRLGDGLPFQRIR